MGAQSGAQVPVPSARPLQHDLLQDGRAGSLLERWAVRQEAPGVVWPKTAVPNSSAVEHAAQGNHGCKFLKAPEAQEAHIGFHWSSSTTDPGRAGFVRSKPPEAFASMPSPETMA
jgi:hypothetical protein